MSVRAHRYHDISCGHRVAGHENVCSRLHGHNYRIHFSCEAAEVDHLGRVIDFAVIKQKLCAWLEDHWDHQFLIWDRDPLLAALEKVSPESLAMVPFNPTAENMARYLVEKVGPIQFDGTGVTLIECQVQETAKCGATYKREEVRPIRRAEEGPDPEDEAEEEAISTRGSVRCSPV